MDGRTRSDPGVSPNDGPFQKRRAASSTRGGIRARDEDSQSPLSNERPSVAESPWPLESTKDVQHRRGTRADPHRRRALLARTPKSPCLGRREPPVTSLEGRRSGRPRLHSEAAHQASFQSVSAAVQPPTSAPILIARPVQRFSLSHLAARDGRFRYAGAVCYGGRRHS